MIKDFAYKPFSELLIMKKKRIVGTLLASSIAFTAAFTGCSLVTSDNAKDYKQVIAEVNIANAQDLSEQEDKLVKEYKDTVGTSSILKSELMAYYLNVGYSYQSNYGWSAEQTFNTLLDGLVDNAVLTQYAVMYLLAYKAESSSAEAVKAEYNSKSTYTEKLEYLLNDPVGEPDDPDKDVKIAKYKFYSALNSAIDSAEEAYLEDEESNAGTETRATPSGADTEKEDFYPAKDGKLDYNVYTGYEGFQLADSGAYKDDAKDGTTKATRIKAYDDFTATFIQNDLIDPATDNLRDVVNGVEYFRKEYVTQLEGRALEKYYHLYEDAKEELLSDGGTYDYIDKAYNDLLRDARETYSKASSFGTAMDNMSDTSFVLYSPDTEGEGTFGLVYNILLPFDAVQSAKLTEYQADYADDDGGYTFTYYKKRNELLKQIKTYDQRSAWFNGTTDYSFKAADKSFAAGTDYYAGAENDREWLFFENNLTNTERYEQIEKYLGKYAYNGKVYEKEEGGYWLVPNKLTIDDMLEEFKSYVDYALGDEGSVSYEKTTNYYEKLTEDTFYSDKDKKEINYENFIYADGKVTFTENLEEKEYRGGLLNKESAQYKALAAVNELQYAYTTDTGVLSNYLGYSVKLGDSTGYIKEFETAAHKAIANGAGSFNVCAGDYGWHLIYVTYTFGESDGNGNSIGGDEYAPDWKANVKVEGTFENLFFEWIKSTAINDISTTRETQLKNQFNTNDTVVKYDSRIKNLYNE